MIKATFLRDDVGVAIKPTAFAPNSLRTTTAPTTTTRLPTSPFATTNPVLPASNPGVTLTPVLPSAPVTLPAPSRTPSVLAPTATTPPPAPRGPAPVATTDSVQVPGTVPQLPFPTETPPNAIVVPDAVPAIPAADPVQNTVETSPVYKKWWFWVLIAGGVGGGVWAYKKRS